MRHMTLADVMVTDVVSVRAEASRKDAARSIAVRAVGAAPVVDADGRVVGMLSETDLLRENRHHRDRTAGTVAAVMSSPAITAGPATRIDAAARIMLHRDITHLPVVDQEGHLIGIVGRSDLLRVLLAPDSEIRERIVRDVVQRSLWEYPAALHVSVKDGVATLSGEVERRSAIPVAVRLTKEIDGVTDVIEHLDYALDDTAP